jgi:hypothetical protein
MIFEYFVKYYQRHSMLYLAPLMLLLVGIQIPNSLAQTPEPATLSQAFPGLTEEEAEKEAQVDYWTGIMNKSAGPTNPSQDPTGASCHSADSNGITYLYGWTDNNIPPTDRTCEIENGKYIYFGHGFECNPIEYATYPPTYDGMMSCVHDNDQQQTGADDVFNVVLDGEKIAYFENGNAVGLNEVESSELFEVNFPEVKPLWIPEEEGGVKTMTGAKTYYIFEKLPPGNHTLFAENFGSTDNPPGSFAWSVKYNLIVK